MINKVYGASKRNNSNNGNNCRPLKKLSLSKK